MDEKKREDKEFIDGASAASSDAENGSVSAGDLLGKLNSNIAGDKRKSRRERKKKKALEETRDTTSDFYDLSINDSDPEFDTEAIIRDVMGDTEYEKYVVGSDKNSVSDDYDEFVSEFSKNVDSSDSSDASLGKLMAEAAADKGSGTPAASEQAASPVSDSPIEDAAEAKSMPTEQPASAQDYDGSAQDAPEIIATPEDILADIVASTDGAAPEANAPAASSDTAPEPADAEVDPSASVDAAENGDITDETENAENAETADADSAAAASDADSATAASDDSDDGFDALDDDIDDTDVQLMVAFGMDDELAKTVGFEKAAELSENPEYVTGMMNKIESGDAAENEAEQPDDEIEEFTSPDQIKTILGGYKKKYRSLLIRMACAALLFILSFLYDNLPVFGAGLPTWMDSHTYPVVYTMFGLQITVIAAALAFQHVRDGALGFRDKHVGADSLLVTVLGFSAIYDIVMCLVNLHGAADGIRMFSSTGVLMALVALIGEYMDFRREVFSFNVIASKKDKYVIETLGEAQATLETNAFAGFMPEDATIFRLGQTKFVDGFFARMREHCSAERATGVLIPIALAAAAVFFALDLFLGRSFNRAFSIAQFTVSIGVPCAAMVIYSMPFFSASKLAYKSGSAIIGARALEEYSTSASAITFEDKDVFPAHGVMVKSIKTYGDSPIDYIISNVASLFMKVGGPLAQVFEAATRDLEHTDDVKLTSVVSGGLEAYIDGRHVYCGNADYFTDNGLPTPTDPEDEILRGQSSVSIMYLAIDGEVAAKLYIQYTLDRDFEVTIKQLSRLGICVGIKTFDPNITDLMLDRSISLADYPIKILRCRTIDDLAVSSEHTESGVASRRSVKSMMTAYSLCEKVLHAMKTGTMLKVLAMVFSFVIVALMILVKLSGSVSSWHAVLYQLAWMVPAVLITRIYVGKN